MLFVRPLSRRQRRTMFPNDDPDHPEECRGARGGKALQGSPRANPVRHPGAMRIGAGLPEANAVGLSAFPKAKTCLSQTHFGHINTPTKPSLVANVWRKDANVQPPNS